MLMIIFTIINKAIYKKYLIMSKPRRDTPPVNYAKPVQSFPQKKKEVEEALSNWHGREELQLSHENSASQKVYQIIHNKAYYKGEWKSGLPNGKGICIYQDGTYLQGNFEDGELNDKNAHIILPNGARYRGNVQNSQIQGQGKLQKGHNNKSNYVYTGMWKDGKPHGKGKEQYGDGSEYNGTFDDGVKHCFDQQKTIQQKRQYFKNHGQLPNQSIYKTANGEIYKGQFKNGLMHGFGEYYQAANGIRYCGEFQQGQKKGQAQLHTSSGVLSGFFENDVVNGKGEYIWNDKRRYVGQFKNNQFHGEGKIYMPNDTILEGVWVEGHNKQLKTIFRQY